MNPIQSQTNNLNDLYNLEGSTQNVSNDQQPQPSLTDEQNQIKNLEAQVLYLTSQLEQTHKRKREEDERSNFEKKVSKLKISGNNQDVNNHSYPIVNFKVNGQKLSFPLDNLKIIPNDLENYSDSKDSAIQVEGEFNPSVVAFLFQSSILEFHSKKLTDIESIEENFEQFYHLTDRFCIDSNTVDEYLKLSVKLSILKDSTGKLILKYISLLNEPALPWLYDVIKSSMIQFSLGKKSENEILTIYKDFFSYIAENRELSRKQEELLADFLFDMFPYEYSAQRGLSHSFIQDFCSAWIALHQLTCPSFLEGTKRAIFLQALERPGKTSEMLLMQCLFNDKLTIESALDKLSYLCKELKSSYLFYSLCLKLNAIFYEGAPRIFQQNLFLLISRELKKLIQMDPLYVSSIFEILKNPSYPKLCFSFIPKSISILFVSNFKSKEVVDLFSEILEFVPQNFETLIKLARAHKQEINHQVAASLYEKALVIKQPLEDIREYIICIETLANKQMFEKALDILKLTIENFDSLNPSDLIKVHYLRARLLRKLDRFQEALKEIDEAINLIPSNVNVKQKYVTLKNEIMKQLS